MKARFFWYGASVLFAALIVYVWHLVAQAKLISNVFLPQPERVLASLERGFASGTLSNNFVATMERMFYGWILASITGIGLGAVIGSSRRAQAYISTTLELLRPLPASAVIPVAIALLGLNETAVLTVIAFGAVWPCLLSTLHGFQKVEPRLYEVAQVLGFSRLATAVKIALPSATPDILAGLRISLTSALALSVAGEMLVGVDGLGQTIIIAGRMFRSPDVFAGVILLAVIGMISAAALGLLDRFLLRWKHLQR
ncbi:MULTISPECIES: ABC transporter permease [Agrobacterium]|uniref:ABC transporter permease n=1 Tax=Agrobacterium rubi TaxID=28099 RepID=A0AAE7R7L8_9HYPH|nr:MULTISPECIES: ABC transporter permease [Agrobacterium]MBN7807836.1 ABC transporter permease [Agrobacterium rosae]NTE89796.1 ABC transporter permease [Agrobacterium rubi]NTF05354.1 ABC transporter permease [Agrobacterium rubi]NTF10490.1 ABC transporter permease [Agrobacterium rubi]NTF22884.1 ABC transporter permease [Agrobacterium rubi]